MSYGIYINGRRPTSKKQVKEAAVTPDALDLENTSMFGGFSGNLASAPDGRYEFVGPDPYTSRKFYGSILVKQGVVVVR